jgi:adenylosuccinate synthase
MPDRGSPVITDAKDHAATAGSPADAPKAALGDVTGRASAVVGLQWGDEGKGKLIDVLAAGYDVVARYNGGANAGHSIQIGAERYAVHLIPSGVFRGVSSVIGNGVVVDPFKLVEEIEGLEQRGIDMSPLRVSDRAHMVLPYHKLHDGLLEEHLAQRGLSIGTTKRGIGPAYAEKANRTTALRMGDLLRPDLLTQRLPAIAELTNHHLQSLDPNAERIDPERLTSALLDVGERLAPSITDTVYLLHEALRDGRHVLFEGANATLLDIDHGTFPYVTSSNCSALGIPPGSGVPGTLVGRGSGGEVLGVIKAYTTRVGGGPFPTELTDATGDRIRQRGNEFGTTTGRPRRCGWLDLVAVRYAAMVNGVDALALTLLDVLSGFDDLRVCTAYRTTDASGEQTATERFTPDAFALERVEPVWTTLPGWGEEITGARTMDDLPAAAREYIDAIEAFVGVPVRFVSVGPDREQTIQRG